MDDHVSIWNELSMVWGVINATERTIELLRKDIRQAFDGLDQQAKALASVNTRIDSLDQSIANLEAAACSSDDDCAGNTVSQRGYERWARHGDPAKSLDEYEHRRSMETAAERGDRPPERGETITVISCLWYVANGYKDCQAANNEVQRCTACTRRQAPLIDNSAQHRRETEVQDRSPACTHQDAEHGTPQWLPGTLWTHECARCGVVEPLHPQIGEG